MTSAESVAFGYALNRSFFKSSLVGQRFAPAAPVPAQPHLAAAANRAEPWLPSHRQRTYAGRASVLVSPLKSKTP
jgi:hypothetical protein